MTRVNAAIMLDKMTLAPLSAESEDDEFSKYVKKKAEVILSW